MSIARSGLVVTTRWIQGLRAPLRVALTPGYLMAAPPALQMQPARSNYNDPALDRDEMF
jgi:hypothetical protein